MLDVPAEAQDVALVLYNDDETPWEFVVDLMRSVFGKTEPEAKSVAATAHALGEAICGCYPSEVADVFLKIVQGRISEQGRSLRLAARPINGQHSVHNDACALCKTGESAGRPLVRHKHGNIRRNCLNAAAAQFSERGARQDFRYAHEALEWHFTGLAKDQMVSTTRQFPGHMRADIQPALDALFGAKAIRFLGIHDRHRYETLTLASLTHTGRDAYAIAPRQFRDVDIGEAVPIRCLENGLWLCREGALRYAAVLSYHRDYNTEAGVCVEIAVPIGEEGSRFTSQCFAKLEAAVATSRSYRGKILSLDQRNPYQGTANGVTVHRLPGVARNDVILPASTLKLLDRNVLEFAGNRQALRALGQSTRKGILLYGPPGTGKTHTIRYLASNMPGHTTLIISAEQVALLSEYMNLARLLQPVLVIIEDADLIARSREQMDGPCEEVLLNKLLNEMDGLKEDADILFILTTNRPEQLEGALAGRPGRIDQAIEIPLPDIEGREKLIRLYGKGLELGTSVVGEAVRRTAGVSAAFIKEMMRRMAQASLHRGIFGSVTPSDLDLALNDMLFTGGTLNARLLGATQG